MCIVIYVLYIKTFDEIFKWQSSEIDEEKKIRRRQQWTYGELICKSYVMSLTLKKEINFDFVSDFCYKKLIENSDFQ